MCELISCPIKKVAIDFGRWASMINFMQRELEYPAIS
jgi:hypothetical protein